VPIQRIEDVTEQLRKLGDEDEDDERHPNDPEE
jgi:hypothetical protein